MRLFLKTFVPVLVWLAVFLVLVNQLVFERLEGDLQTWGEESERQGAVVLARAVAGDLQAGQLDRVHALLDSVWSSRPDIALIEVRDPSGQLIYPKYPVTLPADFSAVSTVIEHERRPMGTLVIHAEQVQIQAAIRGAVDRHAGWMLSMAAGAALLIALSQGLLVLRPVARLKHRVSAWRQGVPAGEVPDYPADELGDLGREFEATREQLRKRDAELLRSRVQSEQLLVEAAQMQIQAEAGKAAQAANLAKSDLLATVSHEIRTPLNGVIGMADLLTRSPLDPQASRQAKTLKDSAEAMLVLLNDILDFSKIEAGRLDLESITFPLIATLRDAVELVQPQATRKGLALRLELDPATPEWLVGDPTRLRQVVLNLLTNALKFTREGSVVLQVQALPAPVEGTARLRLAVQDTGIGIPADRLGRLFQSFSQVDASTARRYGGTGLGLSISQRLVALRGGKGLEVQSVEGEGSTFGFELSWPLATDIPAESTPAVASWQDLMARGLSDQGLRVLVAEDDPTNQYLAQEVLTRLGCSVDLVEDGQAAVDRALSQPYDLILMDLHMPELNGLEATARIRAQGNAIEQPWIAALTASALNSDIDPFKAVGANDHLSKPLRIDEVVELLQRVSRKNPLTPGREAVPASARALPTEPGQAHATAAAREAPPGPGEASLNGYRKLLGDAFVERMARNWLETAPALVQTVLEALKARALQEACDAAHTLKSPTAALGAEGLARLCDDIEITLSAPSPDLARVDALAAEFQAAWFAAWAAVMGLVAPRDS